jgi:hypothetical protein
MFFTRLRFLAFPIGVLSTVLVVGATWSTAGAEPPSQVVADLAGGVYVAPGRSVDPESLVAVVDRARTAGVDLVIVVPNDPEPSVEAYAKRIRQAAGSDAALILGPDGEIEGDVDGETLADDVKNLKKAEIAARAATSPGAAAEAFLTELTAEPPGGVPAVVTDVSKIVIVLILFVGAASVAELLLRARRTRELA